MSFIHSQRPPLRAILIELLLSQNGKVGEEILMLISPSKRLSKIISGIVSANALYFISAKQDGSVAYCQ